MKTSFKDFGFHSTVWHCQLAKEARQMQVMQGYAWKKSIYFATKTEFGQIYCNANNMLCKELNKIRKSILNFTKLSSSLTLYHTFTTFNPLPDDKSKTLPN